MTNCCVYYDMQASMHGVERMKQGRAVRHSAAWEQFKAARDVLRSKQEDITASLVADFKVSVWSLRAGSVMLLLVG